MQKVKYYKCPHCGEKYKSLQTWGNHVSSKHPDLIPEGWSYGRYFYYIQTGKDHGSCIICKNPTEWHEATLKYERFCRNPKCKETYKNEFKNRMIGKYGKVHLLDDPEQQRKMLAHKKISGEYIFNDGTKHTFTGTYEQDFLNMLNKFLHLSGNDIMMPSPHTYEYEYKNPNDKEHEGKHFYIPDAYIPSLNLEIEIKQTTNTHPKLLAIDKVKEKCKDELMLTLKDHVNYIKIVDKNYVNFFNYLSELASEYPDEVSLEASLKEEDKEFTEALETLRIELDEIFKDYPGDSFTAEEAAGFSKENKNPVFIILTRGNTSLANIICKSTGDEFSHSSISFTPDLDPLYSFGTKKLGGGYQSLGFIKTNPYSKIWFADKTSVPYSIYVTFVSDENLKKMENRLEYFSKNADKMKYSFTGLIRVFLKMKSPKRLHWFCSAFVAEIINAGKQLEKDSTLYRPQQLSGISDVELLYSGENISDYDPKPVKEALKEMMKEDPAIEANNSMTTVSDSIGPKFKKYNANYVADHSKYRKLSEFKTTPLNFSMAQAYKKNAPTLNRLKFDRFTSGELVIDGEKVVGYYTIQQKDNCRWLTNFEICPSYRDCGLANQLLRRAIRQGGATNLSVDIKNEVAINLYLKYGFQEYARDKEIIFMCIKDR